MTAQFIENYDRIKNPINYVRKQTEKLRYFGGKVQKSRCGKE